MSEVVVWWVQFSNKCCREFEVDCPQKHNYITLNVSESIGFVCLCYMSITYLSNLFPSSHFNLQN